MNKIIFLDIDGVLNSNKTFININGFRKAYNKLLKTDKSNIDLLLQEHLLEIDYEKIKLLKQITDKTQAKIVVSSAWRLLRIYPLIEEKLIDFGLPIIGTTKKLHDRGEEILDYINENNIKEYIIIDDEVFSDFTDELKFNLIHTSFYQDGLNEEHVCEAIEKLGLKK